MAALPVKVEHRIGVQAPAQVIWEIVQDVAGWPAWNPLYPAAKGEIQFGSILTLEEALPDGPRRTIRPQVTDWTPNEQILWRMNHMGGLIQGRRYIEIEVLAEAGCIFSNGEIFEGFGLRLLSRKRRRTIKAGFTAMGEALRDRAEALFRSGSGGAT
ncbi:MAG: SRPBCC domain-containing protein [Caulobacteraceae bacterium]|nr:SRPBCC domain-containing protein [Caulobacteraceae bacterium]